MCSFRVRANQLTRGRHQDRGVEAEPVVGRGALVERGVHEDAVRGRGLRRQLERGPTDQILGAGAGIRPGRGCRPGSAAG